MNVRQAERSDIPAIYDMAFGFNEDYFDIPLDMDSCLNTMVDTINNHVAFVSDTGFIGGWLVKDPVRDHVVLVETAWYCTGREGIALLNRFIEEGRKLMVDEVRMTTLETSPKAATAILKRKGFAPIETSHRLLL